MNNRYKNGNTGLYVFLGAAALLCFLLASGVLPFFGGIRKLPTPDIMLCFVCTLPLFCDIRQAGIYAVCLGFFADLFVFTPSSLSPVIYLVCLCTSGFLHKYFSRVGSLVSAICTLPCIAIRLAVSGVVALLTVEGASLSGFSAGNFVLGIVSGFACAIIVSFLMRFSAKKLRLLR